MIGFLYDTFFQLSSEICSKLPLTISLSPTKFSHVIQCIRAYSRFYFSIIPKNLFYGKFATLKTQKFSKKLKNFHSKTTEMKENDEGNDDENIVTSRAFFKLREVFERMGDKIELEPKYVENKSIDRL